MLTLALAIVVAAASPSPSPPTTATIVVSGSTNTLPYKIVVQANGSASVEVRGRAPAVKKLSSAAAKSFFEDLHAAAPVDAIKTQPCMKSASFGTTTHVLYDGKQSPDLSCATGDAAQRVNADINAITSELDVSTLKRPGDDPEMFPQPTPTPPKV